MDIQIVGPTMEDMFLNRKGKIDCQVKENKPSVGRIWWEDEGGNEMVGSKKTTVKDKLNKLIYSVSLDITYDEWSHGIKRYCFVEHSAWIEASKKLYERNIGKKTLQPLFNFPYHFIKHVLGVIAKCILSQMFL